MVTALGVVMTVNMKLVPNPADGLAQTVGEVLHRGVGFGKNVIDFTSVGISLVLGLAIAGRLEAIGIGTVIAMSGLEDSSPVQLFLEREAGPARGTSSPGSADGRSRGYGRNLGLRVEED